jgi:perosamine synthetase
MMKKETIPMFYPFMPKSVAPKLAKTLANRWVGQGPLVDKFEQEFSKKFGAKYPVALNSATSGLRLALAIAGVGPNDEVVTTAQTCTATNTPILEQFAKPVFADIRYADGNIDPADVERRITDRTKAIMCVHWAGYPCDMDELQRVAKRHNLPVIEDCAHALGAVYKGKRIGSISRFSSFSFQAIKHITTGDGGMLTLTEKPDYEAAVRRRWYGIDKAKRKFSYLGHDPLYDVTELGYKYNMTDIDATIGIESLKVFDNVFKRRAEVAKLYREAFEGLPKVTLFEKKGDRTSGNWLFSMHVQDRDKFARMMWENGIEVSVAHWRNDKYSIFGGLRNDLPETEKYNKTMICLPLHAKLSGSDVGRIVKAVRGGW